MNKQAVIWGKDLLSVPFEPVHYRHVIDPEGVNVIHMSLDHNDGKEVRVMMMCKLKGTDEGANLRITMKMSDFLRIVKEA